MKRIAIALILGALPLLLYPIAFLTVLMSLLGQRSGAEPILLVVLVYAFLLGSLAYPVVYIFCLLKTRSKRAKNENEAALRFSVFPLGYLLALGVLLAVWVGISPQ